MHDVIGPQQHVTHAPVKSIGQRTLGHVAQVAHGGLHHHMAVHGPNDGGCKHPVANELGHKAAGRAVVEGVGVVPLVQLALMHHANGVANGKGLQLVMGNKQGGGLRGFQNSADLVRQALAQVDVQVRKRLVEQQQARLGGERAGQGHTLLLTARQLMRKTVLLPRQAHQRQHLGHAGSALHLGQVVNAKTHIAPDAQMRKQRVVLKHHANLAVFGRQIKRAAADHLTTQPDGALAHRLQPRYRAQQRGLAAARWANQHPNVARMQAKRHAAHGGGAATGIRHAELRDF